jgi:predicted nucleic acid-binding Zn ribbon protein
MMALLVDDLLKLPFDLSIEVLQAITDKADNECLSTEASIRRKVMETQIRYERGELVENDYRTTMEELRSLLKNVKGE